MKKMNMIKRISSLALAVVLTLGVAATTLAADSTVTYEGRKKGFAFTTDEVYTYTQSDLFDEFKKVMPGDSLKEKVKIVNSYSGCDYIKVWMRGVLHDEDGNPISPKVLEELKVRMASDSDANGVTELEYMNDFLQQLELTVWKGDMVDKNIIYKGSPDSLETGFENGNVYLGALDYKESMKLNVKLEVPVTLGNEYADRIGEVDWVFVIQERNNTSDGPDKDRDPKPGIITPQEPGEMVPQEPEVIGPEILPNVPKTGDDTVIWPYMMLLGIGVAGMILTLFKKRKKENE